MEGEEVIRTKGKADRARTNPSRSRRRKGNAQLGRKREGKDAGPLIRQPSKKREVGLKQSLKGNEKEAARFCSGDVLLGFCVRKGKTELKGERRRAPLHKDRKDDGLALAEEGEGKNLKGPVCAREGPLKGKGRKNQPEIGRPLCRLEGGVERKNGS